MPENAYLVAITALLPLTVLMLVTQRNPYHALIIRGIVGAIAALVYAVFGAADVALTEALVGTMLSITLYAIAVRSSMSLRLGILENSPLAVAKVAAHPVTMALRQALQPHYLRLELRLFPSEVALQRAWAEGDIHATCTFPVSEGDLADHGSPLPHVRCRLSRLYEILEGKMPETVATLSCDPQSQGMAVTASDRSTDTLMSLTRQGEGFL